MLAIKLRRAVSGDSEANRTYLYKDGVESTTFYLRETDHEAGIATVTKYSNYVKMHSVGTNHWSGEPTAGFETNNRIDLSKVKTIGVEYSSTFGDPNDKAFLGFDIYRVTVAPVSDRIDLPNTNGEKKVVEFSIDLKNRDYYLGVIMELQGTNTLNIYKMWTIER